MTFDRQSSGEFGTASNGHGMDVTGPLMKGSPTGGGRPLPAIVHAVAFEPGFLKRYGSHYYEEHTGTIRKEPGDNRMSVCQQMRVRRLTPLECERLQGFKDGYTNIPGASNSARYKALGNSMAVNCMQILGERIVMVENL